jgi:hypothetical protein
VDGILDSDWLHSWIGLVLFCFPSKIHGIGAFKQNYQFYGHNNDINCSNDPIVCRSVRLEMTNNVAEGSFHFLSMKNSFFIYRVPQIDVFVKDLPKHNVNIVPKQSPKIVDHLEFQIQHLVEQ